jgi:hypothetical protein
VEAVLVPDVPDAHAELADRVLEVLDQLGGVERRGEGRLLIQPLIWRRDGRMAGGSLADLRRD